MKRKLPTKSKLKLRKSRTLFFLSDYTNLVYYRDKKYPIINMKTIRIWNLVLGISHPMISNPKRAANYIYLQTKPYTKLPCLKN